MKTIKQLNYIYLYNYANNSFYLTEGEGEFAYIVRKVYNFYSECFITLPTYLSD